jgi:hypothetical protein
MPPVQAATAATTCWNCDRRVERTVPVWLHTPSGGGSRLRFCEACEAAIPSSLALAAAQCGIAIERPAGLRSAR